MTTIVMLKPCGQTNQSKLIYLVPRTKTVLNNFLIGVMCTHCAIPVIVTICLTRQLLPMEVTELIKYITDKTDPTSLKSYDTLP